MSLLPLPIQEKCEKALNSTIQKVQPVSGGDINQARMLETNHNAFFLKFNKGPRAARMLAEEKKGLERIAQTGTILTPSILLQDQAADYSFLLMEFIESSPPSPSSWEQFGSQVADLHRCSNEYFGWDANNFIGSLPQLNPPQETAVDFLIKDRLLPQLQMAIKRQLLDTVDQKNMEQLFGRLPDLIPPEPPALIHGDLWSGNFMINKQLLPVLIDPAVAFGIREMDIAMSLLFGGFDPAFYEAYEVVYPMKSGWRERVDIYQLYYLLVHLNLFGRTYQGSVRRIINRYASL